MAVYRPPQQQGVPHPLAGAPAPGPTGPMPPQAAGIGGDLAGLMAQLGKEYQANTGRSIESDLNTAGGLGMNESMGILQPGGGAVSQEMLNAFGSAGAGGGGGGFEGGDNRGRTAVNVTADQAMQGAREVEGASAAGRTAMDLFGAGSAGPTPVDDAMVGTQRAEQTRLLRENAAARQQGAQVGGWEAPGGVPTDAIGPETSLSPRDIRRGGDQFNVGPGRSVEQPLQGPMPPISERRPGDLAPPGTYGPTKTLAHTEGPWGGREIAGPVDWAEGVMEGGMDEYLPEDVPPETIEEVRREGVRQESRDRTEAKRQAEQKKTDEADLAEWTTRMERDLDAAAEKGRADDAEKDRREQQRIEESSWSMAQMDEKDRPPVDSFDLSRAQRYTQRIRSGQEPRLDINKNPSGTKRWADQPGLKQIGIAAATSRYTGKGFGIQRNFAANMKTAEDQFEAKFDKKWTGDDRMDHILGVIWNSLRVATTQHERMGATSRLPAERQWATGVLYDDLLKEYINIINFKEGFNPKPGRSPGAAHITALKKLLLKAKARGVFGLKRNPAGRYSTGQNDLGTIDEHLVGQLDPSEDFSSRPASIRSGLWRGLGGAMDIVEGAANTGVRAVEGLVMGKRDPFGSAGKAFRKGYNWWGDNLKRLYGREGADRQRRLQSMPFNLASRQRDPDWSLGGATYADKARLSRHLAFPGDPIDQVDEVRGGRGREYIANKLLDKRGVAQVISLIDMLEEHKNQLGGYDQPGVVEFIDAANQIWSEHKEALGPELEGFNYDQISSLNHYYEDNLKRERQGEEPKPLPTSDNFSDIEEVDVPARVPQITGSTATDSEKIAQEAAGVRDVLTTESDKLIRRLKDKGLVTDPTDEQKAYIGKMNKRAAAAAPAGKPKPVYDSDAMTLINDRIAESNDAYDRAHGIGTYAPKPEEVQAGKDKRAASMTERADEMATSGLAAELAEMNKRFDNDEAMLTFGKIFAEAFTQMGDAMTKMAGGLRDQKGPTSVPSNIIRALGLVGAEREAANMRFSVFAMTGHLFPEGTSAASIQAQVPLLNATRDRAQKSEQFLRTAERADLQQWLDMKEKAMGHKLKEIERQELIRQFERTQGHKEEVAAWTEARHIDAAVAAGRKEGELTPVELQTIVALDSTIRSARDVLDQKKFHNTGWIKALWENAKNYTTGGDRHWAGYKSQVMGLVNDYIFNLTGKQLSRHETNRLWAAVPRMTDSDEVFEGKAQTFIVLQDAILRRKLAIYTIAGKDVSKFSGNLNLKWTVDGDERSGTYKSFGDYIKGGGAALWKAGRIKMLDGFGREIRPGEEDYLDEILSDSVEEGYGKDGTLYIDRKTGAFNEKRYGGKLKEILERAGVKQLGSRLIKG